MESSPVMLLLPELILTAGGCLVILLGINRKRQGSALSLPMTMVVLLAAGLAFGLGDRPTDVSPLPGLMLTPLAHFARGATLLMGVLFVLVNWQQPDRSERGDYGGMMLYSLLGAMLTASANDLLVLFLAIELVAVPTYILVALSRTDERASEGSLKYFFLGALSAAILAYGFSFLYGASGTTLMAGPSGPSFQGLMDDSSSFRAMTLVGFVLAFGGLFFKIAAVPFHAYAPDVYEGAASPLTGLLGFLPKFAGFVALIKLMAAVGWQLPTGLMWLLWVVAAASMTVGNVLALLQSNVKRILAYSSISHTGYMMIGLLVGPAIGGGPLKDGVAALLFYIVVYGVMNLGAFAVLACVEVNDRAAETLDDLSGLNRRHPWLAFVLALSVFSLMGFPPTAGFIGKVFLFTGAFSLEATHPWRGPLIALTIIAVLNTAVGAAYYLRIAAACYLGAEKVPAQPVGGRLLRLGVAICGTGVVVLFALPAPLKTQAEIASLGTRGQVVHAESGESPQPAIAGRDVSASPVPVPQPNP